METRLRELMNERGITSKRLATISGIQKGGIDSVLHRGISTMSRALVYAKALRVHVWELFMKPEVSAIDHPVTEWNTNTRILELINERGMNQRQIASVLGKYSGNITRQIHSDNLSLTIIETFAYALQIPVWQLFISPEEYKMEMDRRKGIEKVTITAQSKVEERPQSMVTPARVSKVVGNQLAGCEDAQTEEEHDECSHALADGVYNYGGRRIVLRDGTITII